MPWRCWSRRLFHVAWSGLLQLTIQRHIWWTDDPAAVCPECCCTSHVGRLTVWPHHGFQLRGGLQDQPPGSTVRCSAWLQLTWPLTVSAVVRRRSSSAAFCQLEDLCRQVDLWQLWGPMFDGCQPKAVEPCAFQLVLRKRTSAMNSLSGCSRLICLSDEIAVRCDYLFKLRLSKFSC